MGLEKGLSEKFAEQKICNTYWNSSLQQKLSPDGTRKITPRGIGDGMGGGICSFSHHESREFLIHVNSISCQESPKKHQNLYNVLEEKKNNQSLFLGKVWKRGHAPPHLWPKPSQKSKKCSQKLIEYYIFSNLDPKVSYMYAYNFARQSWVKPAYSRGQGHRKGGGGVKKLLTPMGSGGGGVKTG